jgi:hypothetical protein
MRKVEIVDDPRTQRCWVAVDVKSGEPMLRLDDRELLERICRSLDWKIVETVQRGPKSAAIGLRIVPRTVPLITKTDHEVPFTAIMRVL